MRHSQCHGLGLTRLNKSLWQKYICVTFKRCRTRQIGIYEQPHALFFLIKQLKQITQKQDKRNLQFFQSTYNLLSSEQLMTISLLEG
jgi:hypothetical protein